MPPEAITATTEANALCLDCGLCCDSGLFHHVDLSEDDRARLAQGGFAAPARIVQPCPFHARGCCSVYSARPEPCREYRCELLQAAIDGTVAFEQAGQRVRQAHELRARYRAALPPGTTVDALLKDWKDKATGSRSPDRLRAMVSFVAFRTFVERHFLAPNRQWLTGPEKPLARDDKA